MEGEGLQYASPFASGGGMYTAANEGVRIGSDESESSDSENNNNNNNNNNKMPFSSLDLSGKSAMWCSQLLRGLQVKPLLEAALEGRAVKVKEMLSEAQRRLESLPVPKKTAWYDRLMEFKRLSVAERDQSKAAAVLSKITGDFDECARLYGSVIIAERHLPNELKSIPPAHLGGVAGGQKFVVAGIVFKFAQDAELAPGVWLYGGDRPNHAAAHKAAGHELKGINWIIKRASDLLSVPLMTLVDFHGQRLSAQSLVPIGDGGNLIYGSANAGATIKTAQDHPHHARAIQEAANRFHLAPHRIADAYRVEHIISFPVDIEIHQSSLDPNVLLCLDTARLMPPLPVEEGQRPQDIWCKLFRPEFLSQYPGTLSSDTFSNFGRLDAPTHNANVGEAARQLLEETIPLVAAEIAQYASQHEHFTKWMQQRGVNARFLGRVRHACPDEKTKRLLLWEMIARCAASKLKHEWRVPDRVLSCEAVAAMFINEMRNPNKEPAWLRVALREKYGAPFCPPPEHALEHTYAVRRLVELCGMVVKQKVLLQSHESITSSDVRLEPRLKVLTNSLLARADQFWAAAKTTGVSKERKHALVQKARVLLESNLISDPSNMDIILRLGRTALATLKEASSMEDRAAAQLQLEQRVFASLPADSVDHIWMKAKSKLVGIKWAITHHRDTQLGARHWRDAMELCQSLTAATTTGVLYTEPVSELGARLHQKLCQIFAPLIWDCILLPEDYSVVSACMVDFIQETPFAAVLSTLAPRGDWRTPKYFWLAVVMCRLPSSSSSSSLSRVLRDWMDAVPQLEPHWLTHCAVNDAIVREIVSLSKHASPWSLYQSIVTDLSLDIMGPLVISSLTLDGCNWITSDGLAPLGAAPLSKLVIRDCSSIRAWPARLPPALTELSVSLCPRMTAPATSSQLPRGLTLLKVTDCASFDVHLPFVEAIGPLCVHLELDNLRSDCAACLPRGLRVLRCLKSRLCGSELLLPDLRVASLGTHVTMEGLIALGTQSPLIEEMDLSHCSELLDAGRALRCFRRLQRLVLDGNIHMTLHDVVQPLLESGARLRSCSVTGIWALPGLDLLRVLDTQGLYELSIDLPPAVGFLEVLAGCPALKRLRLCECPSFSELSWAALCEQVAPRLDLLALRQSTWLTDTEVRPLLAGACAALEELEFEALPFVQGTCLLDAAAQQWPRLRVLTFVSCCTDVGALAEACKGMPLLERLDLRDSGASAQLFWVLCERCPLLRELCISGKESAALKDPEERLTRMPLWALTILFPWDLMGSVATKLKFAQFHALVGYIGRAALPHLSTLPCLSTLLVTTNPEPFPIDDVVKHILQGSQPLTWLHVAIDKPFAHEVFQRSNARALAWLDARPGAFTSLEPVDGFFVRMIANASDSSWGWVQLLEVLAKSSGPTFEASLRAVVESFRLQVNPRSEKTLYAFLPFWGDGFSCRLLESLLQRNHHVVCGVMDASLLDPVGKAVVDALRAAHIEGLWFVDRNLEQPDMLKRSVEELVPRLDTVICIQPGFSFPARSNALFFAGRLGQQDTCRERLLWMTDNLLVPSAVTMAALQELIAKSPTGRIAFNCNVLGSVSQASGTFLPWLRMGGAASFMLCKLWSLALPQALVVGINFGMAVPGMQTRSQEGFAFSFDRAAQNVPIMLWNATKESSGSVASFPRVKIPS